MNSAFAEAAASYAEQYYHEVSVLRDQLMDAHDPSDNMGYMAMLQMVVAARTSAQEALIAHILVRSILSLVVSACADDGKKMKYLDDSLKKLLRDLKQNVSRAREYGTPPPPPSENADDPEEGERPSTIEDAQKSSFRKQLIALVKDVPDDHSLTFAHVINETPSVDPSVLTEAYEVWRCLRKVALNQVFDKAPAQMETASRVTQLTVAAVVALARHVMYVSLPSVAAKEAVAVRHPGGPANDLLGQPHANTVRVHAMLMRFSLYAGIQTTQPQPQRMLSVMEDDIRALDGLPGTNLAAALSTDKEHIGFDIVFEAMRGQSKTTELVVSKPTKTVGEKQSSKSKVPASPVSPVPAGIQDTRSVAAPRVDLLEAIVQKIVNIRSTLREFTQSISTSQMQLQDGFNPISDTALVSILARMCLKSCQQDMRAVELTAPMPVATVEQLEIAVRVVTADSMMKGVKLEQTTLLHALNAKASEGEPSLAPAILTRALEEVQQKN